jgi:hypothetical protein
MWRQKLLPSFLLLSAACKVLCSSNPSNNNYQTYNRQPEQQNPQQQQGQYPAYSYPYPPENEIDAIQRAKQLAKQGYPGDYSLTPFDSRG